MSINLKLDVTIYYEYKAALATYISWVSVRQHIARITNSTKGFGQNKWEIKISLLEK